MSSYLSSTDTPVLRIYADSTKTSTTPNGATLQSVAFINPTSFSNVIGNFTFTPTSAFTFLADTRYWLSLFSSTGDFNWRASNPGITPTGISGINYNGYEFSTDSGTSYSTTGVLNTFQINATAAGAATAVPEPASLPGYIVFLGGLLAARKIVKFRVAKKVEFK